jgi:endonuclease/exonuclease/phosphatase family metal-dependent hydrolase
LSAVAALALMASACATATNYLNPRGPIYAGGPPAGSQAARRLSTDGPLRVVSYNIAFGRHIDRAIAVLRENECLHDADVLALQEMDALGVERIAGGLGLGYVYFPSGIHPRDDRDFGCAILSPWPIEGARKIVLPHAAPGTKLRRTVAVATIIRGEQRLRVYSVHLPAALAISGRSRREQARILIKDAATSPDPVIIVGDFNSYGLWEEFVRAGFDWTTRDIPPTGRLIFFGLRFDHIFTKGFDEAPESAEAGIGQDNRRASDHKPVWALLEMAAVPSSGV